MFKKERIFMKKLTVSLFCLMFVLAGCGTTDNRDNMSSAPVPDIKSEQSTEISTEPTEITTETTPYIHIHQKSLFI